MPSLRTTAIRPYGGVRLGALVVGVMLATVMAGGAAQAPQETSEDTNTAPSEERTTSSKKPNLPGEEAEKKDDAD
jgi:hypothetical protein